MEHELMENNRKQGPQKCHIINLSFDAFYNPKDVGQLIHRAERFVNDYFKG
jgi:hypothetical protein